MSNIFRLLKHFYTTERQWLQIWCFIYASFLLLSLFMPDFFGVTVLRYTGICLCLVFAFQHYKNDHLLVIALFSTLLADTILAINHTSPIGVFVFCFPQFFHFTRLRNINPRALTLYFFTIILIFFFGVSQKIEPIFILAAVYGAALIANLLLARRWYKQKPNSVAALSAFLGFLLFLCCDFCVGASYLSFSGVLPIFLYRIANFCAWAFYYPSQIFVSTSSTLNIAKIPSKTEPVL